MRFIACHLPRRSQAFIALLLIGLVLLLNAMAACPSLHELIHRDAGESGHQCAVTLFAHGQVDSASADVPIAERLTLVETVPVVETSVFLPTIENLPAGRAPPVAAFNS